MVNSIREVSKDITPKNRGKKISVVTTQKLLRIIIVEGRKFTLARRIEMLFKAEIPINVYLGKVVATWTFDEMANPLKGAVCDPQEAGVNIVFPIMTHEDALSKDGKRSLSVDEIGQLFRKYEKGFLSSEVIA